MKKKVLVLLSALFMALGVVDVTQNNMQVTVQQEVSAAKRTSYYYPKKHKRKRHRKSYRRSMDRHKVYTSDYVIVGNRRSHIYHVRRQQSYRMNRGNVVIFKSEAAARAAGYRKSKR